MQTQYPVEEISLADIDLNRETQVRASVDEETIIRYCDVMVDMEARDKFPPVTLFRDEDGKLWLADGHHRIMAALRRKFQSILAVVRPGTKEDAIWEAARANSRNGLPLGRADVRRAIIMVLEVFPNKSTTVIAEAVGCTRQYVVKIKSQLTTSCQLTEPAMVEGKDGKMYKAKKNKKPKLKEATTEPSVDTGGATEDYQGHDKSPPLEPQSKIDSTESSGITGVATEKNQSCDESPSPAVKPETVSPESPVTEAIMANTATLHTLEEKLAEAKAGEERIFEMIETLGRQIDDWFSLAPSELHNAFDERLRKRISAMIN